MEAKFIRKRFDAKDNLPDLLKVSFDMFSMLNEHKPRIALSVFGTERRYHYNFVVGMIAVIHELGHAYRNRWSLDSHQFEVSLAKYNYDVDGMIQYGSPGLFEGMTSEQMCTIALGWGRSWMSSADKKVFNHHRNQ